MTLLESLGLEERARHLRDPAGTTGLAVAETLDKVNRDANVRTVAELALNHGAQVLEVGCGTGNMAEVVVSQAENVHYTGLDSSPTMIDAALERRSDLIAKGAARFVCASAERMPFEDSLFTHVFSIGVIHFWPDPQLALAEVRRVMRPGGMMLMGCLGPEGAPPFARAEYGFHLHEPQRWKSFCESAGFHSVEVQTRRLGSENGPQTIHLAARA